MGVNCLNISSFQKIHILCTFCAALYKSWNLPTYYFFISRCQKFNLRYIWKIIIFPFSKRKKNNLTSLRSSEKSHRFSDTKGLSKRDWGLEKLSFFFCSFRHFDEWELFPFGCIISHLQRATFVCSSMKFCRLYILGMYVVCTVEKQFLALHTKG